MEKVMMVASLILIVIAFLVSMVNHVLHNKKKAVTGGNAKNYVFLGMLNGIEIGLILGMVFNNYLPIGICMILGEILGKYVSFPEEVDQSKYKKRRFILKITIVVMIPLMVVAVFKIYMPQSDNISTKDLPTSYMIVNEDNYVATQSYNECAGYATSYVLRHLGYAVEGASLYKEMPTFFGSVVLHNIVQTLKDYNISAQSYHGDIETLKAELLNGVPVIALITITIGNHKGLHYVAVVGYDEEYIYLVDSTGLKANIFFNNYCNRRVTYEEFEELWETNVYPFNNNNLYVVVN